MKERIITALCLIAIVVPAVIFGGIFYKIVIGVAMGLSVYEMLHICSRPRIGMYMYIIVGLFFVTGFLLNRNHLLISSYSILVYLAVILACMIFDDKCNIERSAYVYQKPNQQNKLLYHYQKLQLLITINIPNHSQLSKQVTHVIQNKQEHPS